jgi:hypothetical protein
VIRNPFDHDVAKWDLLVTSNPDVDQLARLLIPDGGGSDRIWSGYARTLCKAVFQQKSWRRVFRTTVVRACDRITGCDKRVCELLARLRKFRGRLPATFEFDRLEANERR